MTTGIIILAVTAALTSMAYLFATAPRGYEDATGFHLGEPDDSDGFDNPDEWGR